MVFKLYGSMEKNHGMLTKIFHGINRRTSIMVIYYKVYNHASRLYFF